MKKNYFNFFSVLLILCCVSFSFSACSSDEDDNKQEDNKSLIVGKWRMESSSQGIDEDEKNWVFNIKSDGTYSNGDGDEYDDLGTWSINDKTFNYKSTIWGLSFSAEIIELTKTHFTAKVKNPMSPGYITQTYKRL